ncbi:MAG: LysM peptidoglycan-binding domain-containing protein [Clostridia bacterium]|nr:LysM peptidoglycan-binding domain-containing protein [Clostridia bacterium]
MKSFYNEYFRIPKEGDGKITDKVMLVKVAQIVVTMIVCLIAMSLSAYAYFSHNVTSGVNIIQSADFGLNVSVMKIDTVANTETEILAGEGGIYQLESGQYTVTLTKKGTASTGFGVIEVTVGGNTTKYHTQQLGVGGVPDSTAVPATLEFKLNLSALPADETATIKITPHWGTSIYYHYNTDSSNQLYIQQNGEVTVTPTVSASIEEEESSNGEEGTTPPDEEAGTPPPDETPDEGTGTDSTDSLSVQSTQTESTTPTEIVHIVTSEDTLNSISKKYGVSIERIVIYNNIPDRNVIETGQRIVIPPDDWVIPA